MQCVLYFVYSFDSFSRRYESCPFGYYTLAAAKEFAAECRLKYPNLSVIVLNY